VTDAPVTVLLVDDEPLNRDLLRRALIFDYELLEASDAGEALGLLERHGEIAVVVCDQMMPGRSGTDLARDIRGRWPDKVAVLLTGYEDAAEVAEARRDGAVFEVLAKPCLTEKIREGVERAVAEHERRRTSTPAGGPLISGG